MKKFVCLLAISCASPVLAQDFTATLEVAPGFVEHWTAPRPFTRVVPGTADVIEILSAVGRELVFTVKPEGGTTNILLLDDNGEQIANLRIIIPARFNTEAHQGPDGWQIYRKNNPDYVRPKEKK
jgi:Pilus formation protein N terminal region